MKPPLKSTVTVKMKSDALPSVTHIVGKSVPEFRSRPECHLYTLDCLFKNKWKQMVLISK